MSRKNTLPRSRKRIFSARGTFGAYKKRIEQQSELVKITCKDTMGCVPICIVLKEFTFQNNKNPCFKKGLYEHNSQPSPSSLRLATLSPRKRGRGLFRVDFRLRLWCKEAKFLTPEPLVEGSSEARGST